MNRSPLQEQPAAWHDCPACLVATPPRTLAACMRSMALRTRSSANVFSCTRNCTRPSAAGQACTRQGFAAEQSWAVTLDAGASGGVARAVQRSRRGRLHRPPGAAWVASPVSGALHLSCGTCSPFITSGSAGRGWWWILQRNWGLAHGIWGACRCCMLRRAPVATLHWQSGLGGTGASVYRLVQGIKPL